MAKLMELIVQEMERSGMSPEEFANKVGFRGPTFYRQRNSSRNLGMGTFRKYAKYFREQNNTEMLRVLGAYALGIDVDDIQITPSN